MCPLRRSALLWVASVVGAGLCVTAAAGQVATPSAQAGAQRARAAAHEAQGRFERDRVRWSPLDHGWTRGRCDEVIGRMCYSDEESGDRYLEREDARIVAAREALLAALAEAASAAPGDPWILGQRVAYLGEAGRWSEAVALAAACGPAGDWPSPDPAGGTAEHPGGPSGERTGERARERARERAWCWALEGLALHAVGRFVESESAFRRAFAGMDPVLVAARSDPEPLLDRAALDWWRDLEAHERVRRSPSVWALANPLILVPGNDLLTEHWARWTVSLIREDARNPYGMRWGPDLEQMLVRYGMEVGWGRSPTSIYSAPGATNAVGYHHPESRPLFPPASVLLDPGGADEADWTSGASRARSAYAPAYAPVLLPGAGRVAVFPRGDRLAVVGAFALPDDTTRHAGHEHPARDSVPPPWRGRASEAGLFALPAEDPGGPVRAVRSVGAETGALALEVPAGRWVVSLEVLSPDRRRAGRTRLGLDRAPLPPDVFTVSDLLLVDGVLPEGDSLEAQVGRTLARDWFRGGERIGVAWELFGLGYRDEVLSYRLSVEREDQRVLTRVARWLGIGGPARTQALTWEEAAPERPGPSLRSVELELPPLHAGRYRVRLEVESPGRAPIAREIRVELRP